MKLDLKTLKNLYDSIKSDRVRAGILSALEMVRFRKDLVRMDMNDVCNIQCIMCHSRPQKCTKEHRMELEDFKKVMDWIAPTTRLLYLSCGYEPLMTPGFPKYLSYAGEKGVPFISFATNGLMMREKLIEQMVDQEINEVIISFNGPDEESYNRIMYRSNFGLILKNLEALKRYKKKKGSTTPQVRFNMILMKSNLLKFDKLMELVKEYGVDVIQFRPLGVLEGQNDVEEVKKEMVANIPADQLKEISEHILETAKEMSEKGVRIIIPTNLLTEGRLEDKVNIAKEKNVKTSCSVPYFSYWITHDGRVSVCGYDPDSYIGNILSEPTGDLKKRRSAFRKKALCGQCRMNCGSMNIDSKII